MSSNAQPPVLRNQDVLLVEYQKAQDSAEHHDRLLWVVVGLLVSAIAALFAIPPGHRQPHDSLWMRLYPPVLGILLTFLLSYFVYSFASFRRQKYERCKAIERILGMEQHLKLKSPQPGQRHVVYGLSFLFLLVWILRLCWELCI
jgi:hypothetical protein